MDALELEQLISLLSGQDKASLDALLHDELHALWRPEPENEPQVRGFYSPADILLYGGSPGGGKTDLIIGLALTQHQHSVIFRRQATDLRGIEERLTLIAGREGWNGQDKILRRDGRMIELGHLEKPGSELSWQGRPHDLIGFDEGAQLARSKVQFVMGWLRSVHPNQRRRVVIASNPPIGGEGEWLVEWFAPWLDPRFENPARDGELRYAATAPDRDGTTMWLPDGRPIVFTGEREYRLATEDEISAGGDEVIQPLTRTFIRSWLRDNPYLAKSGYKAQLQSLPEPLRSQLLGGDFLAGRLDHEYQVIPTLWVKEAQRRWSDGSTREKGAMTAIGVDVAQGGDDRTVLAVRHGPWFAPLIDKSGVDTPNPSDVAGLVVTVRRHNAVVVVDVGGGYGGGVKERLTENGVIVSPFNPSEASSAMTQDSRLGFINKRAEAWWKFREALDPDQDGGSPIALPSDPQILAELTSPRWKLSARGIQIESKDELKKPERLGRSPDKGDAIVMAWSEGERAMAAVMKKARRLDPNPTPRRVVTGDPPGTGWMGR